MPVNFGASNIATSTSLGKRSRSNGRDDEDGESEDSDSMSSESPEADAAADEEFRSALDTLNILRRQDDAAMDALLDAVREQQRQLDSLQSVILDSYQKRRQEYAELQSTVFSIQRRYGGGGGGGGKSPYKRGKSTGMGVQDRFESLGLASPKLVKSAANSKDPADFRKSTIGLVTPTKASRDGDPMDFDVGERSILGPTTPSMRGKAKRTPQNRGMFAVPREVSAQTPPGSSIRRARGLREQSPKKYFQPIDIGDGDDSLYSGAPRPDGSQRWSVNPWELTPSQTRVRNVEVVAKALGRDRQVQGPTTDYPGGGGGGGGENGIFDVDDNAANYDEESSASLLAELNTLHPPQKHPTWNMIPEQARSFSRPTLTKLIGGRIQDTLVNVKADRKYVANIPQYLALKSQGNPFLPSKIADHGVIYLPREYNSDAILPFFACKGQGAWVYQGNYKLFEASPLGLNEWASLSQGDKSYWAKTIADSKWGHELLGRYGIFSTDTIGITQAWKLLNAPESQKHIRLRRQVLRFVEYDRAFHDIIAMESDLLEPNEQQLQQQQQQQQPPQPPQVSGVPGVPGASGVTYSQQEFVPTQSASHSPKDYSGTASYVDEVGEDEEDSLMDDIIPP